MTGISYLEAWMDTVPTSPVSIELDSGPGTLSFTDFNTEEWSDFVYIDIYAVDHTFVEWFSFAGASKPPDIDIFGYARILWNTLSSKGAGFGWVFTFTSNPNITSTTATSMTTTIMAASALPQCIEYDTSTWEAITCTSVTISELDEGYYLISRGMDGYSAGESVSIELDSGPGTLSFTDFNTEEWSDFVYIDIYAVDHTFVEWFSFAGASKPPDIDIFGYARIFWEYTVIKRGRIWLGLHIHQQSKHHFHHRDQHDHDHHGSVGVTSMHRIRYFDVGGHHLYLSYHL